MIDPSHLAELVDYNPDTGVLTWKPRPGKPFASAGKPCRLAIHKDGARLIQINNYPYRINRVAFAIMTGRWPGRVRNHSGDPTDNRWSNLSEVKPETDPLVLEERKALIRDRAQARYDAKRPEREAKALVRAKAREDRETQRAIEMAEKRA